MGRGSWDQVFVSGAWVSGNKVLGLKVKYWSWSLDPWKKGRVLGIWFGDKTPRRQGLWS